MGAVTRKRAGAVVGQEAAPQASNKRSRTDRGSVGTSSPGSSPPQGLAPAGSPTVTPAKLVTPKVPKTGSRGAAFLAAARITRPSPAASPKPSTINDSASKAARRAVELAQQRRSAGVQRRHPLLEQVLPKKLSALLDIFAGLQNVYEVMRKRGHRTTFQNMRQAVEEGSRRRFLLSHLAQLKHLLPEALELEWIRLPVLAHSSRTEPHLLISLDMAAAGEAAVASEAAGSSGGGELQAARHLLHCRLAAHLLDSYRGHLDMGAAAERAAGNEQAAAQLEAAQEATAAPPVTHFVAPFPEGVPDVPEQQLPQRAEAGTPGASRPASPAVLGSVAAAAARLAEPLTPATAPAQPPPSATTGRQGRPPVHPNTVDRHLRQRRRISFGATGGEAAAARVTAAAVAGATPTDAALAAAAGRASKGGGACTPLDKLHSIVQRSPPHPAPRHAASHPAAAAASSSSVPASPGGGGNLLQLHPKQQGLAACLAGVQFNGSIPLEQEYCDDASLLASMPAELQRMSTDGIISMDTLRMLDASDRQHRRLSSKEAQQQREVNAALGQLPRTFSRLQRIFGNQGPNAMREQEVVQRIKVGQETSSELQIRQQLAALAEHAPEFLTLKPWGDSERDRNTPAVWIRRDPKCGLNVIAQRLTQVANDRLQPRA